jgi:maltooligosyltrehalose trehalohydrolase
LTVRENGKVTAGTDYQGNGNCVFTVWAPLLKTVALKIVTPEERLIPMQQDARGYWRVEVEGVLPGARYLYHLEAGKDRPDPASRHQPEGVHGPSEVVDPAEFAWEDDGWMGLPLKDFIIYELHVGTFTKEGTFEALMARLDYLKDLGITAVELMPVAQFPGTRNWGYDGVYPFAAQNSYGGPEGLKRFVNACHGRELAVILDVVCNHLGPEGNYLRDFGPYFTDKYKSPWGDAVNFDGPYSDEVRNYFIASALHWITEYHIDALRIDAIHGIFDFSAKHFLQELGEAVHLEAEALDRNVYVIPESELNDSRVISPAEHGGYGLDAQWNDDFHHALHTLLTGERTGYYEDFGKIGHLEKALREGFVYSGQYSPFRKRGHGSDSRDRPAHQFVVFSQNHDQVGNRMLGDRLTKLASFEALKLAAGTVILSPNIPLLFMGEEYGEEAPFLYFVSHSDTNLIEAVRQGRKEEFKAFCWEGDVPDPQDEHTFLNSTLDAELRQHRMHGVLLEFYKRLIHLRKEIAALRSLNKKNMEVKGCEEEKTLYVRRWFEDDDTFSLYNFLEHPVPVSVTLPQGSWVKVLDSSDKAWCGTGSAAESSIESQGKSVCIRLSSQSFILYRKIKERH